MDLELAKKLLRDEECLSFAMKKNCVANKDLPEIL